MKAIRPSVKAILACGISLGLSSAAYSQFPTPTILANHVGAPDNIIIDGSSVYWGDSLTGNISSVSKIPGGAVTHYPVAMVLGGDLVQDNVFIYFSGLHHAGPYVGESFVYKTSKSGGLTNAISNGGDHGYADGGAMTIGPVGGILYYVGGFRSIPGEDGDLYPPIVSLSTLGGSDTALIYYNPEGTYETLFQQDHLRYWLGPSLPFSFSTDSAFLYWSDQTGMSIWQMPLIGGPATAIVSNRPDFVNVIATPTTGAAAGSIFWVEGDIGDGSLMRREVGGHIITVLTGINNVGNRCFAVDNDKVFCEQGDALVRVSINGGTATVVANVEHAFGPVGVAVDSTYVYWSNLLGQILRVPVHPAPGDFNGDGNPDMLIGNIGGDNPDLPLTRQTEIWYLNGTAHSGSAFGPTPPPGWVVRCVADMNHDGRPDYVLFNASTRQTAVWFLNNARFLSSASGPTLSPGWTLIAAVDMNHDGRPDYVLFNASTRQTEIWYLNGTVRTGTAYGPTLPPGWRLVDAQDFNGDGKPDFLLSNSSTRQTEIWYLNGAVHTGTAYGPTLLPGWTLESAVDFNSDGKPDYVLFNASTRQTEIWYLNGTVHTRTAYGPTLPTGFSLIFP